MKYIKKRLHTFLLQSERYTKTDMSYVAHGGFWLGVGTIITTIITLGLAVAFSHFVPKEVYGNYKFALSIADILGAFTLTGIGTAVLRAAAKKLDGSLKEGLDIGLRWSIPMVLLALIGSGYYLINENVSLASGLLIIALFLPIISSAGLYNSFVEGKAAFKTRALFATLRTGIPATVLFVTLLSTNSAVFLVLAFFASHALVTTFLYLLTSRYFVKNNDTSPETLSYSKHFSVMRIIETVAMHIDKVLIFHFLGGTQLAIYAFATLVPQHVKGMFGMLSTLAFPKFAQKDLKNLKKGVLDKTWKLSILLVGAILIYIVAAPYIYTLLFPAYSEAAVYSQFAILTMIAVSPIFLGTALKATGAVRELHIITISVSVVQILILIPAVMWFGIWGAIIANVITKTFKTLMTFYFFNVAARREVL